MINIPLQAIPNQSLTIQLSNNNYDINISDCGNIMAVTLSINNALVVSGIRAVPGFPIIPAAYLENGNFIFVTGSPDPIYPNSDYPFWERFNIDQFLIYASPEELQAITAGTFLVSNADANLT